MDKLKLDKISRDDLLYFRDSHMSLIHKWQRMIMRNRSSTSCPDANHKPELFKIVLLGCKAKRASHVVQAIGVIGGEL